MGTSPAGPPQDVQHWNVVLIEDNPDMVRQVQEFFARRSVAGRGLRFLPETNWDNAFQTIQERKADLFVLDIYRGPARVGGERIGESVLAQIREAGFVPVILHTNLPEGLEEYVNSFIRLVPKEKGLAALAEQIDSLFSTMLPQMHRAIVNHLDHTLRDYMWDFVVKNWDQLSEIGHKPEFLRVLVHRLAMSFSAAGLDDVVAEVFPEMKGNVVAEDKIHPAEFYIKPALGDDPVLGDVRVRPTSAVSEWWVVLWPTCDMVSVGGRTPKTEKALCARGRLLSSYTEAQEYVANPNSGKKKSRLLDLLKNNRDTSPDRYHFLPGLLDIPDMVVDFQDLGHFPLSEVKGWQCLGSLRSPHAEALSVRFERYRNRIGTPDIDNDIVLGRCKTGGEPAVPGTAPKSDSELPKPSTEN